MFYNEIFRSLKKLIPNFRFFLKKEKSFVLRVQNKTIKILNFKNNFIVLYQANKEKIYFLHLNPAQGEAELVLSRNLMLKEKIEINKKFSQWLKDLVSQINID